MNYYYQKTDEYAESSVFRLCLCESRKKRLVASFSCALCLARSRENSLVNLVDGQIYFNRYPVFPLSYLYIASKHGKCDRSEQLIEISHFLRTYPIYLAICNMYSFPSVPSHFHLEIVNTANLSSGLSWLKCRSQKDSTVSNGIFQAQLNNSPENVIRKVTSVLEKSKIKYGMVMTGEVLYLHPIRDLSDEMTSISSRAMLGIFSTSDRNKFLYMKKKGLEKIFSEHSYSNEDSDMFNREFRNLYL